MEGDAVAMAQDPSVNFSGEAVWLREDMKVCAWAAPISLLSVCTWRRDDRRACVCVRVGGKETDALGK